MAVLFSFFFLFWIKRRLITWRSFEREKVNFQDKWRERRNDLKWRTFPSAHARQARRSLAFYFSPLRGYIPFMLFVWQQAQGTSWKWLIKTQSDVIVWSLRVHECWAAAPKLSTQFLPKINAQITSWVFLVFLKTHVHTHQTVKYSADFDSLLNTTKIKEIRMLNKCMFYPKSVSHLNACVFSCCSFWLVNVRSVVESVMMNFVILEFGVYYTRLSMLKNVN